MRADPEPNHVVLNLNTDGTIPGINAREQIGFVECTRLKRRPG